MPHRMFGQFGPTMVVVRLRTVGIVIVGSTIHPPPFTSSLFQSAIIATVAITPTSQRQRCAAPRDYSSSQGQYQTIMEQCSRFEGKHVYISRWRVCGRCTTASKFDTTQYRPIPACSRVRRNAMSIAGSTISVAGSTNSIAGSTESNRWD
jgi:hypothetical protein